MMDDYGWISKFGSIMDLNFKKLDFIRIWFLYLFMLIFFIKCSVGGEGVLIFIKLICD